jgi:endo-1,4-beta-xylanase
MEKVNPDTIASNVKLLAATGLPIYISEYDVNEASDSTQLAIYKEQFPIFWNNPDVKGITLWGYVQGIIWRKDAYLVRKNGTERPALKWLTKYVSSAHAAN